MENMVNEFSAKQKELENILKSNNLTAEEKKTLLTGIEFGYASAFCEIGVHSINKSQKYRSIYNNLTKKLK